MRDCVKLRMAVFRVTLQGCVQVTLLMACRCLVKVTWPDTGVTYVRGKGEYCLTCLALTTCRVKRGTINFCNHSLMQPKKALKGLGLLNLHSHIIA